ncbi:MAG: Na(+)/H(+) antiporter subunit A, partial [Alphaproteobacteria bacterium MarineAlpha10_Bin1]
MIASLPPALIFFAGALLVALAPGRLRPALTLLVPLFGGWNLWYVAEGGGGFEVALFDYQLELLRADKLALLFGILFHLATFLACLYAFHLCDRTQQVSSLLYAGGALGAVFAGDLITLFVSWEIMAVASVFLIWARRTPRASAAGMRYLMVQICSGLLLLAGAILHISETGSVAFGPMGLGSLAGILIFVAFGIKCAFPLVHSWLTDAYPEATPSGMVFLSAFTTKVAVYGLARSYPGTEALIYIGTAMAMFPIFFAVIENDLRRVLAFSLINQVGFMVVGIGIGTELALNGAVSHAFNDVLFKGLLLMSMGAVLHQTGKINGSELGGLYKTMPITTGLCIVGAASISAFPLFSGFVSKSMVMVAAAEEGHWVVWLLLLFASAGVFHHAGIKIPFFAFFAHDSG